MSFYISRELILYIRRLLPEGSTILELGSGIGTQWLSEYYTMYSVEDKKKYVDRYNSTYIHAYIHPYTIERFDGQKGWYHFTTLKENLPKEYDLILVDGPSGDIGRGGFNKFLKLFRTDVPIVIDDVSRAAEMKLAMKVGSKLDRPVTVMTGGGKHFAVIKPDMSNETYV